MSVEKIQRDLSGLFNYPSDPNPTTQADYQDAVKNWAGSIINLVDSGLWQPTTDYAVGNIIRTPSIAPQYVLVCTVAGQSGNSEPDYTDVEEGSVISDGEGDLTWVVRTLAVEHDIPDITGKANADASNVGVNAETDNSTAWGSAIGGGTVASSDGKLLKGGTVYTEVHVADGNYIESAKTTAQNLTALDTQVKSNTDNVATNTANIADNTADITVNSKDIANIKKLLEGQLYDYSTDSTSAYTKSVPAGAMPYASLDKLGGKTVVWNQLASLDGLSAITNNGVTFTPNVNGSWTVSGTASGRVSTAQVIKRFYIVNGHKYLFGLSTPLPNGFRLRISDGTTPAYVTSTGIVSCTADKNLFAYFDSVIDISPSVVDFSVYITIHDLTLMFGAGNEPSTVAEFNKVFPANWYAPDSGSLLSAGVTGVHSNINLISSTTFEQGTIATATGEDGVASNRVRTDYMLAEPSTSYDFSVSDVSILEICQYKADKTFIRADSFSDVNKYSAKKTTESTTGYIRVVYRFPNNATILPSDVQDAVVEYTTPFATYSIPAEVQSLTGYGWSAGTAHNYIDFERKKFVKCVERVDLGSSNWTWLSDYSLFVFSLSDSKQGVVWINPLYVYKGRYSNITDKTCGYIYNDDLAVRDDSYSGDASAFKTAMSGIYAYYELAEPVETDISAYLTDDNLIAVESGGTLEFSNQNGADYLIPVPSEETYMIDLQEAL